MAKNRKNNYGFDEISDSLKTIVSTATSSLGEGLKTVSERLADPSENRKVRIYSSRAVKKIQRRIRQRKESAVVLMVIFGFLSLVSMGNGFDNFVIGLFFFLGFMAGVLKYRNSKKEKEQLDRLQLYCSVLETDEACKISQLSDLTGLTEEETIKDLRSLISKEIFLSPHLDVGHKMMYVTEEKYRQSTLPPTPEKCKENVGSKEEGVQTYPEEIRICIAEIDKFLKQLQRYTKEIKNQKVISQLDYMEIIMMKIGDYVKKHPENLEDTNRMRKYYLPTTVKLLDRYQELVIGDVKVDSLEDAKKEIEDVLVTLNESYTQLYEDMCQDTSMDIHSDISVLNTLLKQDGLIDDIMERRDVS